jgi:hypothetical protein
MSDLSLRQRGADARVKPAMTVKSQRRSRNGSVLQLSYKGRRLVAEKQKLGYAFLMSNRTLPHGLDRSLTSRRTSQPAEKAREISFRENPL